MLELQLVPASYTRMLLLDLILISYVGASYLGASVLDNNPPELSWKHIKDSLRARYRTLISALTVIDEFHATPNLVREYF